MVSGSREGWDPGGFNWISLYLFSAQPQTSSITRKYIFCVAQPLLALILGACRKCAWHNGPVQRCCFLTFPEDDKSYLSASEIW